MNINFLKKLKFKLLGVKSKYLTVKEIQEIMRNGEPMPTAIFSAKRKQYIVPDRDIHAKKRKKR